MNMKKFFSDFLRRGLIACGFGPLVLAILYLILQSAAGIEVLTVNQVCIGIFSISVLAFAAGGLNALYQIEQLPLMVAILIHGGVLYVCYLGTYLINNWLTRSVVPIIVFSVIFVVGYIVIWAITYAIIRKRIARINKTLRRKQQGLQDDSLNA